MFERKNTNTTSLGINFPFVRDEARIINMIHKCKNDQLILFHKKRPFLSCVCKYRLNQFICTELNSHWKYHWVATKKVPRKEVLMCCTNIKVHIFFNKVELSRLVDKVDCQEFCWQSTPNFECWLVVPYKEIFRKMTETMLQIKQ